MTEEKSHEKKKNSLKEFTNTVRKNPWVLSTLVLGLVLMILIIFSFTSLGGGSISEKKAGEIMLGFVHSQTNGEGEISEVSSLDSNFYEVTVLLQGQEIPTYITKDGKYFVPYFTPLDNFSEEEAEPTTEEVQKSDKPVVELFVMSHCPYGTQAEKGIIPAIEALGNSVDFKIRFVYYVMHPSQGEVEEQLLQYCVQKEQSAKFLPYLKCFLDEGKNETCLTKAGIDKTKLNACIKSTDTQFEVTKNKNDKSSWLSGYYPLFNIDKTLNEKYDIKGSPTLVINGEQVTSARDPASYLKTICQSFTEGKVPSACDAKLSTTAYGAGFGYDTTGNAASTAQC